jgi:hypothetical protein
MYDTLSITGRQNKWSDIEHSLLCFHICDNLTIPALLKYKFMASYQLKIFFFLVINLKVIEEKNVT